MTMVVKFATINISMPPQHPNQSTPPSSPNGGNLPHPVGSQQAPRYGFGSPDSQHFQQHPSGQYEVVPPPPATQSNGRSGHNPYDFIVNPNTKPPKPTLFSGGGDTLSRIAILGGGLVVLLIVGAVVIQALKPKGPIDGLTSIVERQQEIIRISTAATKQTVNQDAKDFVFNVQASATSSQVQLLSLLQANGRKLSTSQLTLDKSTQSDTQLANAATANIYDTAVTANLIDQLQTYESLLKATYSQTTSKTAHQTLQNDYNNADLLLKQARALQTELGS